MAVNPRQARLRAAALKPFWPLLLVYGLLLMSAALIVIGVAVIFWPAGLIVAGVFGLVACTVDLGRPFGRRRRPRQ